MAIEVTAKDLINDQQKRLQRQRQREIYDNLRKDAKLRFKKKPYYFMCRTDEKENEGK